MPPSFWAIVFALAIGWLIALACDPVTPGKNPAIYRLNTYLMLFCIVAIGVSGLSILSVIFH